MLLNFLLDLVQKHKSIREIAKEANTSSTNVRYWLKKYKLKTLSKKPYKCKCGETNPSKFYGNKKQICGKCHNQYTIKKGKEKRQKAILHLGGKCSKCGYSRCYDAIDLHHKDPKKKDPDFKHLKGWSWDRILPEINKCILLCKICHTELHAGIDN